MDSTLRRKLVELVKGLPEHSRHWIALSSLDHSRVSPYLRGDGRALIDGKYVQIVCDLAIEDYDEPRLH